MRNRLWKHTFLLLGLLLLLPFAVNAQDAGAATATPTEVVTEVATELAAEPVGQQPLEPVDVRVMSFNIWRGGDLVDFSQVVAAIKAANADIVDLEEAEGSEQRIADALGWHYVSERMQIISRLPLIDPPDGNGVYIYAQIKPGQVVALESVHLPSDPYGPYAVRDGQTVDQVLELERTTRLPFIQPSLEAAPSLVTAGIPVVLTGDFNSPSYRDWTSEMTQVRAQIKYPVEWPVSKAVEAAGFRDSYRVVYPDPAMRPGITWTYGYPYPRLKADEMVDRIDFVYVSGAVEVLDSQVVGEGPDADIQVAPWPSDHRAVVSTLRVTPGVPPLFVAAEQRVIRQGALVVVRYHAPDGEESDKIALVAAGGDAVNHPLMWLPPYEASFFGSVTFGSSTLTPGLYDAVLIDKDGNEVSRNSFWVIDPQAVPSISTSKAAYQVGEAISATWQNAPALRWDWVGIYAAGDPDLYNGYLGYLYTQATVSGSGTFDKAVLGDAMLPPGNYEARLLEDDGEEVLATAAFSVGP